MTTIRRAQDRGFLDAGWLKSYHSFSFGDYRDPQWMGFHTLRVINTDWVAPGAGFPTHPHRDMEIVSYMLAGTLAHKDSTGTGSSIEPGDVQRMTAGSGLTHSEFNGSDLEPAEFLQIWILPTERGLEPGYEQIRLDPDSLRNRFQLIASPDGREGSLSLHQDAFIQVGKVDPSERIVHPLEPGRAAWLQVIDGEVQLGDTILTKGDGAAIEGEDAVKFEALAPCHVMLFDLP